MALTHDERVKILLVELQALQAVFSKYDDLAWRSRGWAIALVSAFVGWALAEGTWPVLHRELLLVATSVACLFWFQEALLRLSYVYKYVLRYRSIRSTLNDEKASLDGLSVYDLTNHREGRGKWLSRVGFAVFRPVQAVFYLTLALVPFVLFWVTS